MDSRGRSQREAVDVIFRLLKAVAEGNPTLAWKLLGRAKGLDLAGVNSELLEAISSYLRSDGSAESKRQLKKVIAATPYETAAAPLFDDD